jgi:hypothetical protein
VGQFNNVTFRINAESKRKFEEALKQYAYATGKNFSDVANKKLYYVARRSVWYTQAADYQRIAREMGQNYTAAKGKRAGSYKMVKHSTYANTDKGAPLAAILVNFYRAKLGKKGLYGEAMKKAVQKMVGLRLRSIGFLKAGWIAARDNMKRKARIATAPEGTVAGGSRRAGVARLGDAIAAKPERNKAYAAIWNQASYGNKKNPHRGGEPYQHDKAQMKYSFAALKRAFAEETADTLQQVEKAMRGTARAMGIRTN